jgi:hypothetical protein
MTCKTKWRGACKADERYGIILRHRIEVIAYASKKKKSQNYETSTEGQYVASADQRVTALFFGGSSFFTGQESHGCG